MKDLRFIIESVKPMKDGKVTIIGSLSYPWGEKDHKVALWIDKESWGKIYEQFKRTS